ncbi:hypothetical protein [Desulfovibrio sp. JC010]|uniref:hypothetical protein n=1 Tax=Desulfovibrio sp. JC010 TaxID=2593641 RepID=UPI0013CFE689|nr:hypothetical protein [Desulfovibrio sp. JC010]NDV27893.1 hypothetical protein [Desulfovibrio sp. JC010]
MKKIFYAIFLMLIAYIPVSAQELDHLKDLKRPRYGLFQEKPATEQPPNRTAEQPKTIAEDNSRFSGAFKGKVTVHYRGKLVHAEASLNIFIGDDGQNSHYDTYIIPKTGNYLESTWILDKTEVRRSITIAANTIYVTDIIEYGRGGNSQIRTLVFSPDCSALTFLKTEFDDDSPNPATGQIIGRFLRVK